MPELTAEMARKLLKYNRKTGDLVWKVDRRGATKAGDVAGCIAADGRRVLSILGKNYKAHRVIWLIVHGVWPSGVIDHKYGDFTNNRINKLRDVPRGHNQQNQRKASKASSSGVLGVRIRNGRCIPQLKVDGKSLHLGSFDTVEEAYSVYVKHKRKHHPGCTL